MLLHTFHVHLQSGQEHNIVETYPTKKFERVVANQNIKTILTDDDTRQDHANDMRNSNLLGIQNYHYARNNWSVSTVCGLIDKELAIIRRNQVVEYK